MEVFSEAAGTDGARRAAYLDFACGDDQELRAEVESLLATEPHAQRFLDDPVVSDDALALGRGADGDSPLGIDLLESGSSRVGPYAILERIGEGGFGVVFAARQDQPIRREVALKIVKLGMDTRQVIRRFASERQALALMNHPGIARIYDAGATVDGRPYFAMELVRGTPLTDYCDTKRLTVLQRLELFTAVCQAVQHAHQKGIIHRDLKPSNVLVVEVDGRPVPKVIDFGIAKAIAARPGEQTAYTEVPRLIGTPQYMSPEQAGGGTDVDTRSDIYSLGVLLYELLSGATPFDGATLERSPYDEVSRIIREQEPPSPSARLGEGREDLGAVAERRGLDAGRLRRMVGGELDWVVARAMEKDRRRRYESAGALAEDVRRYLAHEPLVAGPPDTLYRVQKFARRYRRSLLAATAVAVALVLGLIGTTFGLVRARRAQVRAQAALAQSEQLSRFLSDMLRSANPDRAQGKDVLVRDVLDQTSRTLGEGELKDQPLVEAGIRGTLGGAYASLGLYTEAEAQYRTALDLRRRVQGPEHPETARAMAAHAHALCNVAEGGAAESLARQALAVQERALGPDHPDLVDTLLKLAGIVRYNGDWRAGEAALRRAVDLCRRTRRNSDTTAAALTNLGVVLMDRSAYDEAEPLLTEALALNRAAHGDKYRNVPRNLSNLAAIRAARGDRPGAEARWLEALRLQKEILPPDHPDVAWTLRLLGQNRGRLGDYASAERYLDDALEMEKRLFKPNHPIISIVLEDLADVLQKEGKRREAADARKKVLEIRLADKRSTLAGGADSAGARNAIGILLLRRGEFERARAELEAAQRLAPADPDAVMHAACVRLFLGDTAAFEESRRAMLRQFARAVDAETAAWAARNYCLSPPPPDQLPVLLGMIARAAPADGKVHAGYLNLCRGLVYLRAGRNDAALSELGRCLEANPDPAVRLAAEAYLCLAHRARGDGAAAADALAAALSSLRELPTVADDGDIGNDPEEWMACQIALNEAKAAAQGAK
jgi:serine/threonine protein kinase/Tfp pilus assembly protein PilF